MRTQEEILERIKERQPHDMLGFEWHEYLGALTAKSMETLRGEILKEDADLSDWGEPMLTTDDEIKKKCIGYMPFAWEKANGCRGISAARSLSHYVAWLWMLGSDEFEELDEYEFYGKPQLIQICKFLGLDHTKWDDGIRSNTG